MLFISFVKDTRGATAIEYGLIVALVSVVGIFGYTMLGNNLATAYDDIRVSLCANVNCD